MAVTNEEINFELLLEDIAENCLTEEVCGTCDKRKCLVGYTKNCLTNCIKNNVTYVENGVQNIPHMDMKHYDKDRALHAIAHILRQCKCCQQDHFDQCLINTIRSSYEVMVLGNEIAYDGSIFMYLNKVKAIQPEYAEIILKEYQSMYKGE